jgi:ATP-dependent Clp protease ATP-binding subunit ClpA
VVSPSPDGAVADRERASEFLRSIPINPNDPVSSSILPAGQSIGAGVTISTESLAGLIAGVALANQEGGDAGGNAEGQSDSAAGRLRCALFCEEAGRLIRRPGHLQPEEHGLFVFAQRIAMGATEWKKPETGDSARFNPVFWLVQNERELPDWFLDTGERVRIVAVPMPTHDIRLKAARQFGRRFDDFREAKKEVQEELAKLFADHSHGMTIEAMGAATRIAKEQGSGMAQIEDAIRAHRVGEIDNPWRSANLRSSIKEQSDKIGKKVLGQEAAIRQSLDIIIRSATGMTAAHGSPNATKPRGVLFFGGPTGVGKTELAKQLATLVFGNESAITRFDMSEFSDEHTAARLIGSPPGYVGFDAGGELTNAMREKPFSLVLFDEVEKADGRILDKFLQILDEGRLTDGRGNTVHFTEAIIVFTSNLGVMENTYDEFGNATGRRPRITPNTPPEEAEQKIREGITEYFESELGRPELLNRIGENVVVFQFIQRSVGEQILELLLRNVERRVASEHGANLVISDTARKQLQDITLEDDIEQGGRGIGSRLEFALVNPLSRVLFDGDFGEKSTLTVRSVSESSGNFELELES